MAWRRRSSCPCGTHRSKYECAVAHHLLEAGVEFGYEDERLIYMLPKVYVPDFTLASGVIVEAKGYFPPSDRQKMEAVIRDNPDRDIRMLFQNARSKIRKGSKTTIGAWCDRRDIKWAEGPEVPEDWV